MTVIVCRFLTSALIALAELAVAGQHGALPPPTVARLATALTSLGRGLPVVFQADRLRWSWRWLVALLAGWLVGDLRPRPHVHSSWQLVTATTPSYQLSGQSPA